MSLLSNILIKQAGYLEPTPEAQLLVELTLSWCLEKNRRYLFTHQVSQQLIKDFEIEPDPQLDQLSKL